jgi:hypothetical protein
LGSQTYYSSPSLKYLTKPLCIDINNNTIDIANHNNIDNGGIIKIYLTRLVDIGNNELYKLAIIPFPIINNTIKIIVNVIICFVLVKAFHNNHSI